MNKFIAILATALISNIAAYAQDEAGVALTIYSNADPASFDPQQFISQQTQGYNNNWAWQVPGFGVVKETRAIDLIKGLNEIKFSDVAQFIDPTTVSFKDITDPSTSVREQNFKFDLADSEKILNKYIDREIIVTVSKGTATEEVHGKLLSAASGQLVLSTQSGVQVLQRSGANIKLGELPGGLISKPTLVWKVHSQQNGKHNIRTTYQTSGITWRSDYNLILNPEDTAADIGAWVTLMNLSGSSYNNASLKLIAGDVQRVKRQAAPTRNKVAIMDMMQAAEPEGFEEKPFFEYHMYTLPTKIDILNNATQQVTLFPTAKDVKVDKLMVYDGANVGNSYGQYYYDNPQIDRNFGMQSNKKLDVYVRFKNEAGNKMGMPLPRGKMRVYKQDSADGNLEFIGEDLIDHTARDEKVLIKLGEAFDVVGERAQTNFSVDSNAHKMSESFKITLRNHKDTAQRVLVKESLFRWTNWQIAEKSDEYEKVDAHTIHFDVEVPARGEKVVTYTAKYSW